MNAQQVQRVAELTEAAARWDAAADDADKRHGLDMARFGPHQPTGKAEMCRRTATALRIQIDTGVAHCACCLKPLGSNH